MSTLGKPSPEEMVATAIARHRTESGLTYEALADRMKAHGVTIHPSAIQKSEKSGRKVSIAEMVAYAAIFGVPVESLWGGESQDAGLSAAWRDFNAAERVLKIAQHVRREYESLIENVRRVASDSPEMAQRLQEQLDSATKFHRNRLYEQLSYSHPSLDEEGNQLTHEEGSPIWIYEHPSEEFISRQLEADLPTDIAAARDALKEPTADSGDELARPYLVYRHKDDFAPESGVFEEGGRYYGK
ncbi:hypothetical protein SAMN04487914_13236 [Arthrobacter sp. ok909]|uniref:helix-turn-helix transcriptional regulator n=1 Tax=Arthrobacter sp. ok909 TaxID=1761746 RepID=UPI000884BD6E|nr:helix-turn-helix transcriptional regulator [Arthrobacter sp. ok909]SDP74029.1 hypothetical protein SAMN04487914_13236 [Arthrobacter sp. ok909]